MQEGIVKFFNTEKGMDSSPQKNPAKISLYTIVV